MARKRHCRVGNRRIWEVICIFIPTDVRCRNRGVFLITIQVKIEKNKEKW